MSIASVVVVTCDHGGCLASVTVRAPLKVKSVPGNVEPNLDESHDWRDSGWQERWDRYDDYYNHYCPDHKREER